jgi:hypothetical protein
MVMENSLQNNPSKKCITESQGTLLDNVWKNGDTVSPSVKPLGGEVGVDIIGKGEISLLGTEPRFHRRSTATESLCHEQFYIDIKILFGFYE